MKLEGIVYLFGILMGILMLNLFGIKFSLPSIFGIIFLSMGIFGYIIMFINFCEKNFKNSF